MSDLDNFEIRSDEDLDPSTGPSRPWWPAALVAVLLLALVGGYFYYRSSRQEAAAPVATAPASAETGSEAPAEPSPLVLPPLAESDEIVRRLAATLSANPDLAAMLIPDNLVQRFTATVVNIAEGESPRTHLSHLAPSDAFQVAEDGRGTIIDPRSYQRYDALGAAFDSLDTAGTAQLYRNLKPLIEEAYRSLGYPAGDFDKVLAEAIGHLLDVPAVEGSVYVTPTVKGYNLADPALQSLSSAQKNLLRTGPENTRLIQGKLAGIVAELGLQGS